MVGDCRPRESGAKRGLEPVEWSVRRLGPQVRVVTPTEMTMMLSLQHNSAETLTRALDQLQKAGFGASHARRRAAAEHMANGRNLIGQSRVRDAFAAGKRAFVLLTAPVQR